MSFEAGNVVGRLILDRGQWSSPLQQSVAEAKTASAELRGALEKPLGPAAGEMRKLTSSTDEFVRSMSKVQPAAEVFSALPGPVGQVIRQVWSLVQMVGRLSTSYGVAATAAGVTTASQFAQAGAAAAAAAGEASAATATTAAARANVGLAATIVMVNAARRAGTAAAAAKAAEDIIDAEFTVRGAQKMIAGMNAIVPVARSANASIGQIAANGAAAGRGLALIGNEGAAAGGALATVESSAGGAAGGLGSMAAAGGPATLALGAIVVAAAAASLGVAELWKVVSSTTDQQDKLRDMAQSAGMNVSTLDALGKTAKLSGGNLEMVAEMSKYLSKNMLAAANGNQQAMATFKAFGIEVKDAGGNIRKTEDVMFDAIDTLSGLEDGATKSGNAMKLFGRGGFDTIAFINEGRPKIEAYMQQLMRLGAVTTEQQAASADAFNDLKTTAGFSLDAIAIKLSEPIRDTLKPYLESLVAWLGAHGHEIAGWANSAGKAVSSAFTLASTAAQPAIGYIRSFWGEISAGAAVVNSWKKAFDEVFGDGAAGKVAAFAVAWNPLAITLKLIGALMDGISFGLNKLAKAIDIIRDGIQVVKAYFGGDDWAKAETAKNADKPVSTLPTPSNKKKATAEQQAAGMEDVQGAQAADAPVTAATAAKDALKEAQASAERTAALLRNTQIAQLKAAGKESEAALQELFDKYNEMYKKAPAGAAGDAERGQIKASFEMEKAVLLAKQQAEADKAAIESRDKAIEASLRARIEQLKAAGQDMEADLLAKWIEMKKQMAAARTKDDPKNDVQVDLYARLLDDQGKHNEAQAMRDRAQERKAIEEQYQADVSQIRKKYGDQQAKDAKQLQEKIADDQVNLAAARLEEQGRKFDAELLKFDAMWQKKIAAAEKGEEQMTLQATYESERRQKVASEDERLAKEQSEQRAKDFERVKPLLEQGDQLRGRERDQYYAALRSQRSITDAARPYIDPAKSNPAATAGDKVAAATKDAVATGTAAMVQSNKDVVKAVESFSKDVQLKFTNQLNLILVELRQPRFIEMEIPA